MARMIRCVLLTLLMVGCMTCSTSGNEKLLRKNIDELNAQCPTYFFGMGCLIGAYCESNNVVLVISLDALHDERSFNDFVNRQSQYKQMLLLNFTMAGSFTMEESLQVVVDLGGQLIYTFVSADGSQRTKIVVTTEELKKILDGFHTMTKHQRLQTYMDSNRLIDENTLPMELKSGVRLTGFTLDDATKTLFFEFDLDAMYKDEEELRQVIDEVPTRCFVPNSLSSVYNQSYEIKHRLHVRGREKPIVLNAVFVVYSAI